MVPEDVSPALLVRLVDLIEAVEWPVVPARRGRPERYGEQVFVKAVVLMVLRRLPSVQALLAMVAEPEMAAVRARLCDGQGRFPSRRTWERRLGRVPARLPASIAALGRLLVARLHLWEDDGRAVALDSTPLPARGKVWHQSQRQAGLRPDTRIDPEAHWTQSGWHGWVYGYTLQVVVTVCPQAQVWLPLAAAGRRADAGQRGRQHPGPLPARRPGAPRARRALHPGRLGLPGPGRARPLRARCARDGRVLVASRRGAHARDDGSAVRQVFHALRSQAIESWNAQFTQVFDLGAQLPTKGLVTTQRFVLGAVLVYQLTLLDRFLAGRSLRCGLQAALQAA